MRMRMREEGAMLSTGRMMMGMNSARDGASIAFTNVTSMSASTAGPVQWPAFVSAAKMCSLSFCVSLWRTDACENCFGGGIQAPFLLAWPTDRS